VSRKQVPAEALLTLRQRLQRVPPRIAERRALMQETAKLYGVAEVTLYRLLRERAAVEHGLSHVGHWQGDRARYHGTRKNLFDLRRCAVVHNLHHIARQPEMMAKAA
jgi:hypothetical protein